MINSSRPRLRLLVLAAVLAGSLSGGMAADASGVTSSPALEVDKTYGAAGVASVDVALEDFVRDLVVQPDGKSVVVGHAGPDGVVVRLLADGRLDTAFGNGGRVTFHVDGCMVCHASDVGLTPDGRIMVSGPSFVARLLPDGSFDPTFGSNGIVDYETYGSEAIAVGPAGEVVFARSLRDGDGAKLRVQRLAPSGVLDNSFAPETSAVDGIMVPSRFGNAGQASPGKVAIMPDGRIVVAGSVGGGTANRPEGVVMLVRYLPSGALDPTFGNGGVAETWDMAGSSAVASDLVLLPDGSLIILGSSLTNDTGRSATFVARYDVAGRLDRGFGIGAGADSPWGRSPAGPGSHLLAPVGSGGWLFPTATTVSGVTVMGLARFDAAGWADLTFGEDGILAVNPRSDASGVVAVAGAPDGTVMVAMQASGVLNDQYVTGDILLSRLVPGRHRSGYWMLAGDGSVYGFGDAQHYGNLTRDFRWVDIEPTPSGKGYWGLASDGGVLNRGSAKHFGGLAYGALPAGEVAVSLSATPSGKGYWVFTNRGRVLAFGDATFLGDMSQTKLNGPVLGSVATPSGRGYYMVASDGGIFAFGDAKFAGSMGGKTLNAPVQSLVPDSDGKGYWLVASDGGIFAFDAPFRGSMGGTPLNKPVVGMVRYGDGYLMVGADGGIFNFSTSPFAGSLGDKPPASPVVAVAALP